jgi:hypothetical protein
MKITKNRLKQIIKEELELAMDEAKLAPAGSAPRAFCVGYVEKDGGERKYMTVHATGPGPAEGRARERLKKEKKLEIRDIHIKSSHEGKCKGHA